MEKEKSLDAKARKEAKRKKFEELAEKRVNNALKQIELIGNLSNKGAYDYDNEDVIKIIKALKTAVAKVEAAFTNSKKDNFSIKK